MIIIISIKTFGFRRTGQQRDDEVAGDQSHSATGPISRKKPGQSRFAAGPISSLSIFLSDYTEWVSRSLYYVPLLGQTNSWPIILKNLLLKGLKKSRSLSRVYSSTWGCWRPLVFPRHLSGDWGWWGRFRQGNPFDELKTKSFSEITRRKPRKSWTLIISSPGLRMRFSPSTK